MEHENEFLEEKGCGGPASIDQSWSVAIIFGVGRSLSKLFSPCEIQEASSPPMFGRNIWNDRKILSPFELRPSSGRKKMADQGGDP